VALLASFETAHREEGMRQFMAVEREALVAMLMVRSNAASEVARVAEAAAELAAREGGGSCGDAEGDGQGPPPL
jgi:hypothetical protein